MALDESCASDGCGGRRKRTVGEESRRSRWEQEQTKVSNQAAAANVSYNNLACLEEI